MRRDGGPEDLLRMADGLLRRTDPATAGLWPRASAILALQALEASLGLVWKSRALALGGCPMRAQLLCLGTYLGDASLAARTRHAWSLLDRACHHHAYELAPTAAELRTWVSAVEDLVEAVRSERPDDERRQVVAGERLSAPAVHGRDEILEQG